MCKPDRPMETGQSDGNGLLLEEDHGRASEKWKLTSAIVSLRLVLDHPGMNRRRHFLCPED
jgi:hypothetical protein